MVSWRLVGTEVSAVGAAALSMPLRLIVRREHFDPVAPHPTPAILGRLARALGITLAKLAESEPP